MQNDYVSKYIKIWPFEFGLEVFRCVRKTSNTESRARYPHPIVKMILDHLDVCIFLGLPIIVVMAYQLPFYGYSIVTVTAPPSGVGVTFNDGAFGVFNAVVFFWVYMVSTFILHRLIPRLMGYRRVPQWELHAERRAELLARLDEKERARYLLDEDARDQAYRRGVATGYVAGRNSGRRY
ncbi:hypothetical protein B1757_02765 [Acidithiobacillus marinus]|uniref:Uncharacterized protein n=1 Tax=Acidithiobacillus marinus TaxID=187490 RepID=A0A2I1DPF0_9PROT|nr:hypothetical protein [Acidithiobacillus marinus]PKY11729.1 hypothetical protein B1757_02765 [Acidithiobacillus marinus]